MKPAFASVAAAIATAAAISSSTLAQTPTPQQLRTETPFDIVVHPPCAETAQLFGPEGERAWAGKHWNPQFLFPHAPHDEQGAVFTVQHGAVSAVWVNALFDLESRHFIYAYFIPDIMVTTIDVRFTPSSSTTTQVHVVYTRTALTPEGNGHVSTFTATDKTAAHDWQHSIDTYLATRNP